MSVSYEGRHISAHDTSCPMRRKPRVWACHEGDIDERWITSLEHMQKTFAEHGAQDGEPGPKPIGAEAGDTYVNDPHHGSTLRGILPCLSVTRVGH